MTIKNHVFAGKLMDYEATGITKEIVLEDIWFWPLVRAHIVGHRKKTITKSDQQKRAQAPNNPAQMGRRLHAYGHTIRQAASYLIHQLTGILTKPTRVDVIALTRSSRYKRYREVWVDTILDPIAEALEQEGLSVAYWGWEPRAVKQPSSRPVFECGRDLDNAIATGKIRNFIRGAMAEPSWFASVHDFCINIYGHDIQWPELAGQFRIIQAMRRHYEKLWRRCQPGLLLTDCWYDWPLAAGILAAKSCRSQVCDIQHGIQEHIHPCFHGWCAIPPKGYLNPFPETVWVWGPRTASLYEGHTLIENLLIGGHEFQTSAIRDLSGLRGYKADSPLKIGYSVTWPLALWLSSLRETIKSCPREWVWIFRTHPSDRIGPGLLRQLKDELIGYNIDLEQGQEAPVVEFLAKIDVHATHHSTCALEALALGKSTLITDPLAIANFEPWIDAGVFLVADDPRNFPVMVKKALEADPARARQAASKIFATSTEFQVAAGKLLELARQRMPS